MENQKLPRLTIKEIKREALLFFNLEKGIPFTLISLLRKPYETLQTYLSYDRRKYSNPIKYLIFTSAIYLLIISLNPNIVEFAEKAKVENAKNYAGFEKKVNLKIAESFQKAQEIQFSYQNVLSLFSLPLLGFFTYLFFKPKYNYAENLAINAFVNGTSSWVGIALTFVTSFFTISYWWIMLLILLSSTLMMSYLYKSFFKISSLKAFLTSFFILSVSIFLAWWF